MQPDHLTDDQKVLAEAMSDYSEDRYCAGWVGGLEFILWKALMEPTLNEDLTHIKQLSERCGGWIVWNDEAGREDFVPMAEWLAIFGRSRYAA